MSVDSKTWLEQLGRAFVAKLRSAVDDHPAFAGLESEITNTLGMFKPKKAAPPRMDQLAQAVLDGSARGDEPKELAQLVLVSFNEPMTHVAEAGLQISRLRGRISQLELELSTAQRERASLHARLGLANDLASVAHHIARGGDGAEPHTDAEKAWVAVLSYIEAKRGLFMDSPFLAVWRELEDLQIAFNDALLAETKMLGAALDAYTASTPPAGLTEQQVQELLSQDEPPVVPELLADMTPEEREAWRRDFNGARLEIDTTSGAVTVNLPAADPIINTWCDAPASAEHGRCMLQHGHSDDEHKDSYGNRWRTS
jgi:hypothetical protein